MFKHRTFDEPSRVKASVDIAAQSLNEVFDMRLCLNPEFRTTSEQKWMTKRGTDNFSGVNAAHVGIRHPGQGVMEVHQQSVNGKVGWTKLPNENKAGREPFAMSYPESARTQMESIRSRNPDKQVGDLFNSTIRSTKAFEDKVKINSWHNMENLQKGYLMTTSKDPHSIRLHSRQSHMQTSKLTEGVFEES